MKHINTRKELLDSLTVDDVKKVLQQLGATEFIDNINKAVFVTNTICHNDHGGKMKLYCYENDDDEADKFSFHCYTGCSCSYSLFDIVMIVKERQTGEEITFPQAINFVSQVTGKETNRRTKGFGFNRINSTDEDWEILNRLTKKPVKLELNLEPVENENVLQVFSKHHHSLFLNDNISHEAMDKFEIGYYVYGDRITIPHRCPKTGRLVGIRGRAVKQEEVDAGYKYLPLTVEGQMYNFPSHGQLYGLWQNRETIKRLKKVVIFESEKSVLQCESYFDKNFTVALMGKSISQYQIDMLLELGVETVIFAMDKEFKEADSVEDKLAQKNMLKLAKKFVNYCTTYVLWDTTGLLDYKDSPSDKGKEVLCQMLDNKQEVWMEE